MIESSYEVYNMMLESIDKIVADDTLLTLFTIHENLWPAIRKSWKKGQTDFQGRFDMAWDGVNPPKVIEFNGDTPSL